MELTRSPTFSWHRPVLALSGPSFIARAAIALYDPTYWNPSTPLGYAAVLATGLALVALGAGSWGFYRRHPAFQSPAHPVWRVGMLLSSVSGITTGFSNFFEDALRIRELGYVWIFGILVLFAGLIVAGLGALWIREFPRWAGALLLVCALGLFLTEGGGMFAMGLALLFLGLLEWEENV